MYELDHMSFQNSMKLGYMMIKYPILVILLLDLYFFHQKFNHIEINISYEHSPSYATSIPQTNKLIAHVSININTSYKCHKTVLAQ